MSWSVYRWAWQLESPLYVGMAPAGTLNRCRLYLPARNLWASLTSELAQRQAKGGYPDYLSAGKGLKVAARFTYLFPGEQAQGTYLAWTPMFRRADGLVWQPENAQARNGRAETDRAFRRRLMHGRPSTALAPGTGAVAEGTLREIECMNRDWKADGNGQRPVVLVGYLFWRDQDRTALFEQVKQITALSVGGDTRYGLGRLRRVDLNSADHLFGAQVELGGDSPHILCQTVLAHAHQPVEKAGTTAESAPFAGLDGSACPGTEARNRFQMGGALERLSGWDLAHDGGLKSLDGSPLWMPGSTLQVSAPAESEMPAWEVLETGYWRLKAG